MGLPEDALADLFDRLDGLCLAGGVDVDPAHYGEARHPALGKVDAPRDATELTLARWALAADLPLFGICRGIQLLNVAAGGSLYQDLAAQMPAARSTTTASRIRLGSALCMRYASRKAAGWPRSWARARS